VRRAESEGGPTNAVRRAESEGGPTNAVRRAESEAVARTAAIDPCK